jgi:hypothetical protein
MLSQDCLYTLVERSLEGDQARIIGSIVNFLNAAHHIGVEIDDRRRHHSGHRSNCSGQPPTKANIRPTRMPTSRLDTGFRAAARIANPRGVKRKKRNTRIKTATETLSLRLMVRRIRKISCTDERGETERWLVEHQELRPQHGVAHILRLSSRF